MKRKKSKFLAFSLLTLCVACLAFGVYALKNANMTVTGTIGFTAHDCVVNVKAYIEGDGLTAEGVTATDGQPSAERALNFKNIDTNEITVGGASESEWERLGELKDNIYFTDLTDDGTPAQITMTFRLKNQSVYDVYARIENAVDLSEKGVTVVTSDEVVMQKMNDSDEDKTDEATLTAVFTLDTTKINAETGLSEGFELKLDFGKYVNENQGEEGSEGEEDADGKITYGDFKFTNEEGVGYTLVEYTGSDTIVTLPETAPDGSSEYILGKFFETIDEYNEFANSLEEDDSIENYAIFGPSSNVTQVNIPASIKKIGNAFAGAQSLTNVTFIGTSSLEEIGIGAFLNSSLSEISLPKSLKVIKDGAFSGARLQTLSLPSNLTEIGNMAFAVNSISEVTLHNTIQKIGYGAFLNQIYSDGSEGNKPIKIYVDSTEARETWDEAWASGFAKVEFSDLRVQYIYLDQVYEIFEQNDNMLELVDVLILPMAIGEMETYLGMPIEFYFSDEEIFSAEVVSVREGAISNILANEYYNLTVSILPSLLYMPANAFENSTAIVAINVYCAQDSLPEGWDSNWASGYTGSINYITE